jgi:catechol 2,3-dioxygenase-like lactoylglutathione lyase family enzyme
MKLGCFSVSLAVKDLAKSKAFYEKLGFTVFAGAMEMNYLIMQNGETNIGLFQGMFEGNLLTFNPGWDQKAQNTDSFTDVREIEKSLESESVNLIKKVTDEEGESGPASITFTDPDGNVILIDQHR